MKPKIGIYGGCFNPIHNGHLFLAECLRKNFLLDKIIFVPSGNAPHKHIKVDKEDRFNMTTLALEGSNFFEVSDYEIKKNDKSYTINTLEYVRENNLDAKIYLIIGADAFLEIKTWHKTDELLQLCSLLVVIRPGISKNDLNNQLRYVKKNYLCEVSIIEVDALNISSTDIRNKIMLDENVKQFLPEKVFNYITTHNLYKPFSKIKIVDIKKYLAENLSDKRFIHSLNVAEEAVKLAKKYDENIYKAYIAGLLHDCAKEIPNSQKILMCNEYGMKLDRVLARQPDLTHSFLAAQIAHYKFSVNDTDILHAISYHTTGKKRMSMLEKIIYIADCIEPNRTYEQIKYLRELAYENINKAVAYTLKVTMAKNKEGGRIIHPLSLEAFQFYKSNL